MISPNYKNYQIKESKFSYEGFVDTGYLRKFYYIIKSLLQLKPLQLGYFYNPKIEDYIINNYEKYNYLFFQSFRSVQYLPKITFQNTILDMADIVSNNYNQASKKLFFSIH